jgi:anti-sigma regulatory factor (Ser/Thr protein kinase)
MNVRTRGEQIRRFIIEHVEKYPSDIAKHAANKFGISRQAINKHLKNLVDEKVLLTEGATKNRKYKLCPLEQWEKIYHITPALAEDIVWRKDVAPSLRKLPQNVLDIWHYGFTEMFNNAIDHSSGSSILLEFKKTAASAEIILSDDGIGIFKKIQSELDLLDERHAILELAKGKLTTDPDNHTGEGIFFTSRAFDEFDIFSGGTYFSHKFDSDEDWIIERKEFSSETTIWMRQSNHTSRKLKEVFDKFTSEDDFGFTKTVVPVRLAQYGDDELISRSQAKRLLVRVDRFKTVILDFKDVESIGQAFSDEIFRVFQNKHPEVELAAINTNTLVKQMINRTRSTV